MQGTLIYGESRKAEPVAVRTWAELERIAEARGCRSIRRNLDGGHVERLILLGGSWVRL